MHQLPQTSYIRLPQIVGNPKAEPPIPAIILVGKSTWWQGVKDGRFPKPVKLGPITTACRVEDIRALSENISQGERNVRQQKSRREWRSPSGLEYIVQMSF
ncbi:AlpA family transcriptional regulator (modular protein) [Candidatus Methylobacter favarea]|uniref:AlpA family transcriptional regulator (Modular protein) n=1 Tax=Candidatus Methylobacter favarea TaxID=2707345 RepID=A0A8S0W989_9GAMM|nr:AlpA family phage regulatory protein [Candidatus Methylobacter favarea]CAA9889804.1 AlpA family transcriptional regulator (modular protein) [Candidatus Methylobacter favarea]